MKKIIVLGANGMLGGYMVSYLMKNHNVIPFTRKELDVEKANEGDIAYGPLQLHMDSDAFVVNCSGMIKPQVDKFGTLAAIRVNSVFPHLLADVCEKKGTKMFHITTDCVFSGQNGGGFVEDSPHDALDVYGKTKSLGEPKNCMNLRTSIIGEEKTNKRSLLEWVKSNAGNTVNGFTNHFWNGLTCLQLAKVIDFLIKRDVYELGVRHIYTPLEVTKYELVKIINDVYNLGITVIPVEANQLCDRTLSTQKEFLAIKIPSIPEQVSEQKKFHV